jgi:hypothetical protein
MDRFGDILLQQEYERTVRHLSRYLSSRAPSGTVSLAPDLDATASRVLDDCLGQQQRVLLSDSLSRVANPHTRSFGRSSNFGAFSASTSTSGFSLPLPTSDHSVLSRTRSAPSPDLAATATRTFPFAPRNPMSASLPTALSEASRDSRSSFVRPRASSPFSGASQPASGRFPTPPRHLFRHASDFGDSISQPARPLSTASSQPPQQVSLSSGLAYRAPLATQYSALRSSTAQLAEQLATTRLSPLTRDFAPVPLSSRPGQATLQSSTSISHTPFNAASASVLSEQLRSAELASSVPSALAAPQPTPSHLSFPHHLQQSTSSFPSQPAAVDASVSTLPYDSLRRSLGRARSPRQTTSDVDFRPLEDAQPSLPPLKFTESIVLPSPGSVCKSPRFQPGGFPTETDASTVAAAARVPAAQCRPRSPDTLDNFADAEFGFSTISPSLPPPDRFSSSRRARDALDRRLSIGHPSPAPESAILPGVSSNLGTGSTGVRTLPAQRGSFAAPVDAGLTTLFHRDVALRMSR